MDDEILHPANNRAVEGLDLEQLKSLLAGYFHQLADLIEKKGSSEAFITLQAMLYQNNQFDKACIYMFRKMTKNFLLKHSDANVNGFPINLAGAAEGMDLKEYLKSFVMKMQEDA